MKSMKINYSPFGDFYSDFKIEKAVNFMIDMPLTNEVSVSSEMALDCFRLAVKECRLKPMETYINYTNEDGNNYTIPIDSDGNFVFKDGKNPKGFGYLRSDIICKLLLA